MTSRAVLIKMPLRDSPEVPDPGINNRNRYAFVSLLSKINDIVYIVYSFVVGAFLILLPYLSFWGDNFLLKRYPGLRRFVVNPFLKGAVIGLGIVNLIIGLQEFALFRKNVRNDLSRRID